jgi:hypothetical protein
VTDPGFDASEEAALERISLSLRADGWAAHVTVGGLLRDWRGLSLEADCYTDTIDDYTNDLTARDGLEIALARCDEPLRNKLRLAIDACDFDFLARTTEDGGAAINRYCNIRSGSGWWWRRRPNAGPLAKYLGAS